MTKHKNPHPDSKHAKTQTPTCKGSKCGAVKHKPVCPPECENPNPHAHTTELDRQLAQDAITTGKSAQIVHPDGTRERVRLSELYRHPNTPAADATKRLYQMDKPFRVLKCKQCSIKTAVGLEDATPGLCPKGCGRTCEPHDEGTTPPRDEAPPEVRHTKSRWVYHFSGHARLHATRQNPGADSKDQAQAVPFEVVIRRPWPVTSDSDMELARVEVRGHIVNELGRQGSPYIVGDVMIRSTSFLHHILVDHDNLDGEPVKVTI